MSARKKSKAGRAAARDGGGGDQIDPPTQGRAGRGGSREGGGGDQIDPPTQGGAGRGGSRDSGGGDQIDPPTQDGAGRGGSRDGGGGGPLDGLKKGGAGRSEATGGARVEVTEGERLRLVRAGTAVDPAQFAEVVRAGLSSNPKQLPYLYFYDESGSELFEEICRLPEYYLTRAEREILTARAGEIASLLPSQVLLAELGSGSAVKTRLLIEEILRRQERLTFIPVDISSTILEASSLELLRDHPGLEIVGIAADYEEGLRVLSHQRSGPMLILWLGSNVGNLARDEAASFLRLVGGVLTPEDRLLLGVDLRKDRATLEAAYDDAAGVTARFNLNLLVRINRELGGRFDLARFKHRAIYDDGMGRIEMYLVSEGAQTVAIDALGLRVPFEAGETIHTENSYKYSLEEIDDLGDAAGLAIERRWFDAQSRFCLCLLSRAPGARAGVPAVSGR